MEPPIDRLGLVLVIVIFCKDDKFDVTARSGGI